MLQLVSLIGLSGGISGDVHASSVTNKQGIRSTCIRASAACMLVLAQRRQQCRCVSGRCPQWYGRVVLSSCCVCTGASGTIVDASGRLGGSWNMVSDQILRGEILGSSIWSSDVYRQMLFQSLISSKLSGIPSQYTRSIKGNVNGITAVHPSRVRPRSAAHICLPFSTICKALFHARGCAQIHHGEDIHVQLQSTTQRSGSTDD